MKKSIYITLLLSIVISAATKAQTSYVSIYTGYALGINKTSNLENYSSTYNWDTDEYTESMNSLSYSLGEGINFGGALGYMVNENFGFEIGVNHSKSKSFVASESDSEISTIYNYRASIEYNESVQSKMTRISPSIIYQLNRDKFSPYAKFGMVLGMGSITTSETFIAEETTPTENYKLTGNIIEVATGGVSLGVNSTLGALFPVSESISVFGEVSITNLNFAPNESKLTEAKEDGVDFLSELDVRDKNTKFTDKYTEDSYDPDVAQTSLKEPLAFSNIAFNLGIKLNLNKK
jgi:hypothetical protein